MSDLSKWWRSGTSHHGRTWPASSGQRFVPSGQKCLGRTSVDFGATFGDVHCQTCQKWWMGWYIMADWCGCGAAQVSHACACCAVRPQPAQRHRRRWWHGSQRGSAEASNGNLAALESFITLTRLEKLRMQCGLKGNNGRLKSSNVC